MLIHLSQKSHRSYFNNSTIFWYEKAEINSHHNYSQVSNIRRTLDGNNIVDNSDAVGASPVGAAPTTSSLST